MHGARSWRGFGTAEFQKRAAYALLASLALHDKVSPAARFLPTLKLIERDSTDERNFVKKGISWALRLIGRRSQALNAASVALSRRLAESSDPTARWLGEGCGQGTHERRGNKEAET